MSLNNDQISVILGQIIRREGGFVNNPSDKGGPTNFGITQDTLSEYLSRPATVDDVKNLSEGVAREIYRKEYISPFLGYDPEVAELLIDCGVNHGVGRAKKWADELKHDDPKVMYNNILKRRIVFYGQIVEARPSQSVFIEGWLKRAVEFIK